MTKPLTLQPGVGHAPAGNNVQDNPDVNSQRGGCDSGLTEQNQSDECWEVKQTPQGLALHEDRLIAAAEKRLVRKKNISLVATSRKKAAGQKALVRKHQELGESGWGHSSLKCFSQSTVRCYSLPRFFLICGRHTHIHPLPLHPQRWHKHTLTQIKLNLSCMFQFSAILSI